MKNLPLNIEYVPLKDIVPYENNAKLHPRPQIEQIKASIAEFGMNDPIAVDEKTLVIIEGHGRLIACKELGYIEIPIIRLGHLSKVKQDAYRIAHNKLTMNSDFDIEALEAEMWALHSEDFDLALTGFNKDELKAMDLGFPAYNDGNNENAFKTLAEKFLIPPFSIFDTRQGYWQARKKAWLSLGIKSELGRGGIVAIQ
ncbi:MAG: ParB domain protein nuclease [Candidatus Gottesmanbacteria bacterium GW2011_GWB1_49_7]|uniref:ParB domain protein nuclease n=1 Tax=Candidatus Gottesmanbacteria bacterium GW2011_GWB1_49_7 TaxID=1618448 RepID=A0A0G1VVC3_9BACT|nr:MAG: ParB domain protein nuclease [Candidatus Gottesmanbacteria bacterium GW2011_GWB1_49_7]